MVDLVVSGCEGGTDAGGTAGVVMFSSGRSVGCSDPKLSTEDEARESVGEYSSILKSGLRSLAIERDGIDSWSLNETVESRLSPVVTTDTVTPPLLFMCGKDEVPCDDAWNVPEDVE